MAARLSPIFIGFHAVVAVVVAVAVSVFFSTFFSLFFLGGGST